MNINLFATENTYPDLTLLFDIDPKLGLARIAANASREVNRLDLEKLSFHEGVRKTFLELAARYPERFVIIDASKSPEEVVADSMKVILARLEK